MSKGQIILAVIGFFFTLAVSVVGYFVKGNDRRLALHDARDDDRFKELSSRLDRMQEDSVDRRHSLRNEIHLMVNELHSRLREDMIAMEQRLRSNK